jgi:phage repressor protein C with HTH and peptisase S24 domain
VELARMTGINEAVISNYLNGRREPMGKMCIAIAKALNVSLDELLESPFAANSPANTAVSPAAQRIARAYEKATPPVQRTVEVALEPFILELSKEYYPIQVEEEGLQVAEQYGAYNDGSSYRQIPIYDLPASAGGGEFLDGNNFDIVTVGPDVPDRASFGVRISGDSMEPDYPDGWIAWVQLGEVRDGEVGVFAVNDDGYVKKQGQGELISLNSAYDPLLLREDDDVHTYGRVIAKTPNAF